MTIAFNCLSCKREISVKIHLIYEEHELKCTECKTKEAELINKTLDIYQQWIKIPCPLRCGGRGLPKQIKDHLAICPKRKLRYRCLHRNCRAVETIDKLFCHVRKTHQAARFRNIIDDCELSIKLKKPRDNISQLVKLHNGARNPYAEFYWLLSIKLDGKSYITVQHICTLDRNSHLTANRKFSFYVVRMGPLNDHIHINPLNKETSLDDKVNMASLPNEPTMITLKMSSADCPIPRAFVNKLFCGNCERFMTHNIYSCEDGHSICSDCCLTFGSCTKCTKLPFPDTDMENTRNDEMTRCKNECCREIVRIKNISRHESKCPYNEFVRYSKDLPGDVKHYFNQQAIKLGVLYPIFLPSDNMKVEYLLRNYDAAEKFILTYQRFPSDDPDLIRFSVVHSNSCENDEYYFVFKISDPIAQRNMIIESKCKADKFYTIPSGSFKPSFWLEYSLKVYRNLEQLSFVLDSSE